MGPRLLAAFLQCVRSKPGLCCLRGDNAGFSLSRLHMGGGLCCLRGDNAGFSQGRLHMGGGYAV